MKKGVGFGTELEQQLVIGGGTRSDMERFRTRKDHVQNRGILHDIQLISSVSEFFSRYSWK